MKGLRGLFSAGALLLFVGCPGGPDGIDASGAYPSLGEARATRDLRTSLVVMTETFQDLNLLGDEGTMRRPTGYTIYTEAGVKVLYVRNFIGSRDTEPTAVELEAGRYLILLDRPGSQAPLFRVVVEAGKRTTVPPPR